MVQRQHRVNYDSIAIVKTAIPLLLRVEINPIIYSEEKYREIQRESERERVWITGKNGECEV